MLHSAMVVEEVLPDNLRCVVWLTWSYSIRESNCGWTRSHTSGKYM